MLEFTDNKTEYVQTYKVNQAATLILQEMKSFTKTEQKAYRLQSGDECELTRTEVALATRSRL